MEQRLVLVVERAFTVEGRGTFLVPSFNLGDVSESEGDEDARLRLTDGRELQVCLSVYTEWMGQPSSLDGPHYPRAHRICVVRGVDSSVVVPGVELWCRAELAERMLAAGVIPWDWSGD